MVSSSTVCLFQSTQIAEDTLLIPYRMMEKLKLKKALITVSIGTQQRQVMISPTKKTSKIGLHPLLAQELYLTDAVCKNIPLHYTYDKRSHHLQLGPVIVVLVNPIKEELQFPFGNITTYAEELSKVAKQKGLLLYFLTPEELPTISAYNRPYYLNGWQLHDSWGKVSLPFPNVVYNRIASRQIEQSEVVQQFFTLLNSLNIPYFNSRFFDKDEVFKALQLDSSVKKYLPYSELLVESTQITNLIKQYNTLYIKPIHGRLGKDIMRIQYSRSSNKYKLEQADRSNLKAKYFQSIDQLLHQIKPKLKLQSYQVQEGISLIHAQQKPVDFRVLVQKNGTGQWTVTSIVARTAAADIFVSNLAKGGTITPIAELLPLTSLQHIYSTESLATELKHAALLLARSFEKNSDAILGELGIDMGLDEKGQPWLLEINCKPSKLTSAKLGTVRVRPSVRMLIAYSLFLSGFKQGVKIK